MSAGCIKALPIISLFLPSMVALAGDTPWSANSQHIGAVTTLPSGLLSSEELTRLTEVGEALFKSKFTTPDGAGRPGATQAIIPTKVRHQSGQTFARLAGPDAQACSSCHNDPLVGGAGDFVTNVFVSEGFTNSNFDTSDPQFSNERGTNHLFGAGLIELLAREMSADLIALRSNALRLASSSDTPIRVELKTKGVFFGFLTAFPDGLANIKEIEGVDADLVIRPFSQKGVMTSLRQFTVNALNHHHGMQAVERFGERWTGEADFDEDGKHAELSAADISAMVAWQATLGAPAVNEPASASWKKAAVQGAALFSQFECNSCHRTELPLNGLAFADPGPYDVAGTLNSKQVQEPAIYDLSLLEWAKRLPRNATGDVMVPLFGDLKRHKMTDRSVSTLGNELLSQRFVGRDIFMTAELWGVGSTAPFGHRNDFTTLDEIIMAHGGAGRKSRDRYFSATSGERSAVIAFLKTLVIE